MVFGLGQRRHKELTPQELDTLVREGKALVVDVREADEYAAGHIPGAINVPLSIFRASALPDAGERMLVLNCLGGKRSAMALEKCAAAQTAVDTHLAGGFGAWKSHGLPVEY